MKLKPRLKAAADLVREPRLMTTTEYIRHMERKGQERATAASTSPLTANAAGVGYTGPVMPDKGKKDGSCNVTACQMPLAGNTQFFMDGRPWSITGERLYYCASCERGFTKWDNIDRPGQPPRCTLVCD